MGVKVNVLMLHYDEEDDDTESVADHMNSFTLWKQNKRVTSNTKPNGNSEL